MKRTLIPLAGVATILALIGVAVSAGATSTNPVVTTSSQQAPTTPAVLSWNQINTGDHVCIHMPTDPTPQWNATITNKQMLDGDHLITFDQDIDGRQHQNVSLASGYGLEPDPKTGRMSPAWMTGGNCT